MRAATWPRPALSERLLTLDPGSGELHSRTLRDLPQLLHAGDLLVLNDAATLPASLRSLDGRLELRLMSRHASEGDPELASGSDPRLTSPGEPERQSEGASERPSEGAQVWDALVFGEGDWRTPTEERPLAKGLAPGEVVQLAGGLHARIEEVRSLRELTVRFLDPPERLWSGIFRGGRPVQYAYLDHELPLWHLQTSYGARPWAVETPSAGRPLTWKLLLGLRRVGVRWATVTEAAGLSSSGDAGLDATLPRPERYALPQATVEAIHETRSRGGRVIAVGTSVVRALEGSLVEAGCLRAGEGVTSLRIDGTFRPRLVDGLLTGVHDPEASHYELLQAFAPLEVLRRATAHAEAENYLGHELGDLMLLLPGSRSARRFTREHPRGVGAPPGRPRRRSLRPEGWCAGSARAGTRASSSRAPPRPSPWRRGCGP